jgi:hypothetical protein
VERWFGEPDATEREIGLPAMLTDDDFLLIGEDDVLRVAGVWSVNPDQLADRPAQGELRGAAV